MKRTKGNAELREFLNDLENNDSYSQKSLLALDELDKIEAQNTELLEALKEIYKTACDAEDKDRSNGWVRDIKDIADLQLEAIKKQKDERKY